jgi:hypothetical protein
MSAQTFVMFLCLGAALLAFWIAVRFPNLGPGTLTGALLHLAVSVVVGMPVAPVMSRIISVGFPFSILVAVFAVALPALVYMFLAGAWLIRTAQAQALHR